MGHNAIFCRILTDIWMHFKEMDVRHILSSIALQSFSMLHVRRFFGIDLHFHKMCIIFILSFPQSNRCFDLWNWTSHSFFFHLVKIGPFTDLYIEISVMKSLCFFEMRKYKKRIIFYHKTRNRRFKKWNDHNQIKLLASGI